MLIISYFIFIMMDVKIYVVIMVVSQIADSQFADFQIADIWKISYVYASYYSQSICFEIISWHHSSWQKSWFSAGLIHRISFWGFIQPMPTFEKIYIKLGYCGYITSSFLDYQNHQSVLNNLLFNDNFRHCFFLSYLEKL
jgi:hypothetical protein